MNENEDEGNEAPNNMKIDDERRIFEYFIVAGLNDKQQLEEFPAQHSEGKSAGAEPKAPITDICVVFTSAGETTPAGYERIETTPSGYPANLNHGSLRSAACFICFKRGYHKPPLIDLGILDENRGEKAMRDAIVIDKTPYGLSANVSNSSSQGLYFTIRRAQAEAPPHQLVITDICVILENKGELPPHTYYKIPKNLNRSMLGSEVYICYKKSQLVCRRIAYKPAVLDCFPRVKSAEDSILVQNVPKFFLPMGATIEAWPKRCKGTERSKETERSSAARTFSTCVFTDEAYTKYYGASVTFYEPYTAQLKEQQREKLDLGQDDQSSPDSTMRPEHDEAHEQQPIINTQSTLYYCNKAICIVSRYPFFEPFRRFLFFLLNTITVGESRIPIERYMYEVPFPSPARPRILVELGNDMIAFESSDDSQIPLTGASFVETLKCLGTDNFLYAMLLTLLEQKILVHSLRPWLLASVTETFCALIFPFSWQLPYIPQCPLEVADIFHAPLSFMAGVDSRYFDLKEDPPSDVTCFDLDTATVSKSTVRKFCKLDMLPKKPLKRLRSALDTIALKNAGDKTTKNKDSEQAHLRRMQSELDIREAFLKFICALMDGYTDYLCPIMHCPQADDATDIHHLFDWNLFLQSREKSAVEFYQKFRESTCFIRFIEERSGALAERNGTFDRSIYYVFFDDCIARLRTAQNNPNKEKAKEGLNNLRLLDGDSLRANRTVVVQSPQILNPEMKERKFVYSSFPREFTDAFFEKEFIIKAGTEHLPQAQTNKTHTTNDANFHVIRTRQEIRKSMADVAILAEQNLIYWPRSVLFYAYSIWFMQLPSLMVATRNKRKMLLFGLRVLSRMEQSGLPFHDQICYRLLMQLCGEYNHPEMAIIILRKMLRLGIVPNAITYKVYHQALIRGNWPTEIRRRAIDAWRRIQMRIDVSARFRSLVPNLNGIQNDHPLNVLPEPTHGHQHQQNHITDEVVETSLIDGSGSIVREIGVIDVEEDDIIGNAQNQETNDNPKIQQQTEDNRNFLDPLGAEITKPDSSANKAAEKGQSKQKTKEGLNQNARTKIAANNALPPNNHIHKTKSAFLSPSREKFIREHSASPFATEDKESADNKSVNSEKRKRRSLKLGSSWFKSIAANSPILNTLISKSNTTENLDKISRDGSSVHSDAPSGSTTSASPNLLTLAKKMRKQAMRTYNDMIGPATELLERSGLNPARMLNEAKLNLSKSYRSTDQSGMSILSASNENLDENGDFYLVCTRRSKDLLPINYWMQDILPEDNSELRDVWLRKDQNNDSFSHEEFLDVLICSTSICSNCDQPVYDDELTLGWSVDDANLNSHCQHCQHSFLPSLKICIRIRQQQQVAQAQSPESGNNSSYLSPSTEGEIVQAFTVPYISPLVLRRELETLLASEGSLFLSRPSMRISHPIIFWNMFYYCRRLELPTHLLTWVSPAVVIHCVQDMPRLHNANTDGQMPK